MDDIDKKKCHTCEGVFSLDKFSKDKQFADGLNSSCKKCVSDKRTAYYIKNRDAINNKSKEYWESHKKEKKAYHAKWQKEVGTPRCRLAKQIERHTEFIGNLGIGIGYKDVFN